MEQGRISPRKRRAKPQSSGRSGSDKKLGLALNLMKMDGKLCISSTIRIRFGKRGKSVRFVSKGIDYEECLASSGTTGVVWTATHVHARYYEEEEEEGRPRAEGFILLTNSQTLEMELLNIDDNTVEECNIIRDSLAEFLNSKKISVVNITHARQARDETVGTYLWYIKRRVRGDKRDDIIRDLNNLSIEQLEEITNDFHEDVRDYMGIIGQEGRKAREKEDILPPFNVIAASQTGIQSKVIKFEKGIIMCHGRGQRQPRFPLWIAKKYPNVEWTFVDRHSEIRPDIVSSYISMDDLKKIGLGKWDLIIDQHCPIMKSIHALRSFLRGCRYLVKKGGHVIIPGGGKHEIEGMYVFPERQREFAASISLEVLVQSEGYSGFQLENDGLDIVAIA